MAENKRRGQEQEQGDDQQQRTEAQGRQVGQGPNGGDVGERIGPDDLGRLEVDNEVTQRTPVQSDPDGDHRMLN